MNLIWLDDFLALAATGNFSRAAEERNSSQPAFSRRIRALEEWLGAELFDRSSQPATLTEAGEWFVGIAHELLNRVARVPGEAQRVAEASSSTLRIACTHALSMSFLPRWIRSLESRIVLGPAQLVSDVMERCESLMRQSKVQFLVGHSHAQARGALDAAPYRSVRIGDDALIPVSAPDESGQPLHRLGGQTESAMPVLLYAEESGLGRIMRAVIAGGLDAASMRVVFTAHLASALRTLALDGRGVAWLPQSLVEEDLRRGRLLVALEKAWAVPLEIRLYCDGELHGKAARTFWSAATGQALAPP
ncbi:MAG: LysR family transcriptional regulator [Burkholderiales bacterium]|nr:LysR family transcriptional regulator [Burkholderiales bacterium]